MSHFPKIEGGSCESYYSRSMSINMSQSTPLSGLNLLALDMKDLVKKIQNLSHLGIEDSNIRLPKICVVGDQSTGKSSVIEAISEIQVPRSEGTCTRCPLEINLSESDPGQPWKCVISLTQRYIFDPNRIFTSAVDTTDGRRRTERLGPWARPGNMSTETDPFCTVTDRAKLKAAIWWAQIATLNPSQNPQDYVPGNNEGVSTSKQVKFSPNVVRLDISGPDFPTLSFFDLPGVINQPEVDEEGYLVNLVSKLVKEYVSQESCIILLALSMTDDATNSSAAAIVRGIRRAKERTIGVLTKPDRVASQHETLCQWSEILDGAKFQLGHGYYVVKNNPDPNIDHARAREQESEFFTGTFWAGAMASFQDRFGVPRLQNALSVALINQIKKCLPGIIYQIENKAQSIDNELKTLPDPPTDNVQHIVLESVIRLGSRIESIFNRGPGSSLLQKSWNELVTDFQKALFLTRPTMQTIAKSDTENLAEREIDYEGASGPSPLRLKRKAIALDTRTESPNGEARPRTAPTPVYLTTYFENWKSAARKISLDEVRQLKQETNQVGIPNQIDPSAVETLKKESVQHWDGIAKDFAKALLGAVQKILYMTLDEVIVNHRQTGLYRELHQIMERFLIQIQPGYLNEIAAYCRMEYERPFTLAEVAHKEAMEKAKSALIRGRNKSRAKHWLALRGIAEENADKIDIELLGPDPYAHELEMVANARGYYEVASARFLDVICLIAESKLRSKCRDELIHVVNSQLRIDCADRCIELMAEDPERQSRRITLTRERAKLSQAQEWLTSANQNPKDDDHMDSEETMEEYPFGRDEWPTGDA